MLTSSIGDLGDLRTYAGVFEIDGTGQVLAALAPNAVVGAAVSLDAVPGTLQPGTPADLMLLSRSGENYHVGRIFRAQEEVK